MITFCLALAIYTQSPFAYEALQGSGILQLPGVFTLKTSTSFNLDNSGFSEERMAHARQQYDRIHMKMLGDIFVLFTQGSTLSH